MTDLTYSDVEVDAAKGVSRFLQERWSHDRTARLYDGDAGASATTLAEQFAQQLGLETLLLPAQWGGGGATAREAAAVIEELGRSVAPLPYLFNAVACGLLAEAGADVVGRRVADEGSRAVVVSPLTSWMPEADMNVTMSASGLSGMVGNVAGADSADFLVVPARQGSELVLVIAPRHQHSILVREVSSLDMSRPLSEVTFAGATGEVIASGPNVRDILFRSQELAAGLLASEQLGVAQWCLDSTLDHVRTRYQFGRAIGSYQAVKHRLADLWVEINGARAAARHAADQLATDGVDRMVSVALAQSYCSEVAVHAAEIAVQLHGGIGMTWEHPVHLYLKRAKVDEVAWGTPDFHRTRLSQMVDLAQALDLPR